MGDSFVVGVVGGTRVGCGVAPVPATKVVVVAAVVEKVVDGKEAVVVPSVASVWVSVRGARRAAVAVPVLASGGVTWAFDRTRTSPVAELGRSHTASPSQMAPENPCRFSSPSGQFEKVQVSPVSLWIRSSAVADFAGAIHTYRPSNVPPSKPSVTSGFDVFVSCLNKAPVSLSRA